MKERIEIKIDIDCSELAKKIGKRCDDIELEERVIELVNEEVCEQVKYYDGIEWDEYKRIIKVVDEYLKEDYPLNEEYDGYDGQ